jgi:hypothetical protein
LSARAGAGSGGGNLALPLAALAPWADVVACDYKLQAVQHVLRRAALAGLPNVRGCVARLEDDAKPCEVVVALHCCGAARRPRTSAAPLPRRTASSYSTTPCL